MSTPTLTPVELFEETRPASTLGSEPFQPPIVYEIVPKQQLPFIDLHRSVGSVLFSNVRSRVSPEFQTKVEKAFHVDSDTERAHALTSKYAIGHILAAVACFVPKLFGMILAIISLVITLPSAFNSLQLLQYDVLLLLIRTYDFWFFFTVSTLSSILLILGFGDLRGCIAIILWFGNLQSSFVDANTKLSCRFMLSSISAAVLNLIVMLAFEMGFIQDGMNVNTHIQDLLSNALTTMIIFHFRNVYRRHMEIKLQSRINCHLLRCINYRTRVTFHPKDMIEKNQDKEKSHYYLGGKELNSIPCGQMLMVTLSGPVNGNETCLPFTPWSSTRVYLLRFFRMTGIIGTVIVSSTNRSSHTPWIAILSLLSTMIHWGIGFGLYQRQLILFIITSFDFLFLSLQVSTIVLSAAFLFRWDTYCIALASIWIWLHWVMTIDALTPMMRRMIGFRLIFIAPITVLFLASQVMLAWDLVSRRQWVQQDIVIHVSWLDRSIGLSSFLLGRLGMSFLWGCRLLYRIATSNDKDAIILLGRVAYSPRGN